MPSTRPTAWIRLNDLAEVSFWISVTNSTSQRTVPANAQVEITELSDKGLVLTLPAKACAEGHFMSICIRRTLKLPSQSSHCATPEEKNWEDQFSFTAKVTEIQPLNSRSVTVALTMYQFEELQWKELINTINAHQNQIAQIVSNIRN